VLACALAASLAPAAAASPDTGLQFGFTDDTPQGNASAVAGVARDLGASAFRLSVSWRAGQTALGGADAARLDRAVGALSGMQIFLAVYGRPDAAPTTAGARNRYCTFVANVLARYPAVNDAVIWLEPNLAYFWRPQYSAGGASAAPAAYEALLARCWDAVHAVRPTVRVVGPSLSPRGSDNPNADSNVSHSPGTFIRELGGAYRKSGRKRPILDVVSHHAYGDANFERPWFRHIGTKLVGEGDWNKLMWNFWLAFNGTAQPIPGECGPAGCVRIAYLESGFETTIDASKRGLYRGREIAGFLPDFAGSEPPTPAPKAGSRAPDQSTQIVDAVRLAYCQPYVDVILNFLLKDERDLRRWQSAPFWADGTPKDSVPAFRAAGKEVNARAVDCSALKGGPPSADFRPPPRPSGLTAELQRQPLSAELKWEPSSDPSGIDGYRIYRSGAYLAWSEQPEFVDRTIEGPHGYSYTVFAQDRAGNLSAESERVLVFVRFKAAASGVAASATSRSGRRGAALRARIRRRPLRVLLRWRRVGAVRFVLFRGDSVLGRTTRTRFVDRRPPVSRNHYRVIAYDRAGRPTATGSARVRVGVRRAR
jgi:hypothetical protein